MENKIDFSRENILLISNEQIGVDSIRKKNREKIEPWLTAVF